VRDASAAERLNVPTVLLITAGATQVAEATRRVTGLEPWTIVAVRGALFGRTRAEIARVTKPSAEALLAALGVARLARNAVRPHA